MLGVMSTSGCRTCSALSRSCKKAARLLGGSACPPVTPWPDAMHVVGARAKGGWHAT